MKGKLYSYKCVILGVAVLVGGCQSDASKSEGSIRLGDSSTIVTETDTQYLKNNVADYSTNTKSSEKKQEVTVTKPSQQDSTASTGSGVAVQLKKMKLNILDATSKTVRRSTYNSYVMRPHNIPSTFKLGSQFEKAKMKYKSESKIIVNTPLGDIDLGNLTSSWKTVPATNNLFKIDGGKEALFATITDATLRAKLRHAVESMKIRRKKDKKKWIEAISKVKSVKSSLVNVEGKKLTFEFSAFDKQSAKDVKESLYFTF